MYYCNDCAEERAWPQTPISHFLGVCEVCQAHDICNDCPSSKLSIPPDDQDDQEDQKESLSDVDKTFSDPISCLEV